MGGDFSLIYTLLESHKKYWYLIKFKSSGEEIMTLFYSRYFLSSVHWPFLLSQFLCYMFEKFTSYSNSVLPNLIDCAILEAYSLTLKHLFQILVWDPQFELSQNVNSSRDPIMLSYFLKSLSLWTQSRLNLGFLVFWTFVWREGWLTGLWRARQCFCSETKVSILKVGGTH